MGFPLLDEVVFNDLADDGANDGQRVAPAAVHEDQLNCRDGRLAVRRMPSLIQRHPVDTSRVLRGVAGIFAVEMARHRLTQTNVKW
jgi:hypothetical protein